MNMFLYEIHHNLDAYHQLMQCFLKRLKTIFGEKI